MSMLSSFIKKAYLDKSERQWKEIHLCFRSQTLLKIVVVLRALGDHYVLDCFRLLKLTLNHPFQSCPPTKYFP